MRVDPSGTKRSCLDADIAREALEFDVAIVGRRAQILEHLGSIARRGIERHLGKTRADPIDRDDAFVLNVDRVASPSS
jgi:hypothetical protein